MGHKETETINKAPKQRRKEMKKFLRRKNKRFISLLLGMMLTLSMGMTAFAAEADSTPKVEASIKTMEAAVYNSPSQIPESVTMAARSAYGYAADYTDSQIDSFVVNVSGSAVLGSAKLTAWDFPAGTKVYLSLQRPNGNFIFTDRAVTTGNSTSVTFSNLQSGPHVVYYTVQGAGKGWVNCEIK